MFYYLIAQPCLQTGIVGTLNAPDSMGISTTVIPGEVEVPSAISIEDKS
ncbi:hypothetical protein MTsPCn5_26460 [Croceitalea sp. MTPC5]|nr:hypothetical protein MTsPCn5_26460 [Croceitalea sp. MTPC5]